MSVRNGIRTYNAYIIWMKLSNLELLDPVEHFRDPTKIERVMSTKTTLRKNHLGWYQKPQNVIILLLAMMLLIACSSHNSTLEPEPAATNTPQVVNEAAPAADTPQPVTQQTSTSQTTMAQHDGFDRITMVKNVVTNAVVPLHEAFEAEALALKETIRAFDADPNMATLTAMQQAWRDASDAWAGCQLFSSQRAILIQNQISKWPAKVEFIEKFIAGEDSLNAAFVASIGSSSKGLPAIEYLIFDPASPSETILATLTNESTGARRRAFLVGLGDHLYDTAIEATEEWTLAPTRAGELGSMGKLMAEAEQSGDVIPVLQLLMNGISEQLEDILNMNLRGVVNAELGMPIQVEAPYSNYSVSHIVRYVEAFKLAYAGGEGDDMLGFDDYLNFLQIEYTAELMSSHIQTPTPNDVGMPLADVVYRRIDEVLVELNKVEEPLADSIVQSPQSVKDAYDAALRLLILVRVDMVNNFGVTLTFNDGD